MQQRRLVNLLHLAHVEPEYEGAECGLSLVTTVHECLHSANFWELENIRCESTSSAVLFVINNLVSIVLCCSTRENSVFGLHRCCENTGRRQEAREWPIREGSNAGSNESLYHSALYTE